MTNIELKAQIDSQITNETTANAITPTDVGVNIKSVIDYVDQEVSITPVSSGLVAQGTTISTTSILTYGINIFGTSTQLDYATKLPQPVTGKRVKVVNKSSYPITLYPSNVGGWIGTQNVDVPVTIPADGRIYEFNCIENPLPGGWSFNNPSSSKVSFLELSVTHVNGTATNSFGVTQAGLSTINGMSLDGSGNLILNGEWKSEDSLVTLSKLSCNTNILQTDLNSEFSPDAITTVLVQGYKNSINGSSYGQKISFSFSGGDYYNGSISPIGTINFPSEVNDSNTLYDSKIPNINLIDKQLGIGGLFSRNYYTFGMFIPASAASKTYMFKWVIEYN